MRAVLPHWSKIGKGFLQWRLVGKDLEALDGCGLEGTANQTRRDVLYNLKVVDEALHGFVGAVPEGGGVSDDREDTRLGQSTKVLLGKSAN